MSCSITSLFILFQGWLQQSKSGTYNNHNHWDLTGGSQRWSFSTIFSQGHQSVTLQFSLHVLNTLEAGADSLLISACTFKASVRFPSPVWNAWLINIPSHAAPIWKTCREMSFRCSFGWGFVLPCSFIFLLKDPWQPDWDGKMGRQSRHELVLHNVWKKMCLNDKKKSQMGFHVHMRWMLLL